MVPTITKDFTHLRFISLHFAIHIKVNGHSDDAILTRASRGRGGTLGQVGKESNGQCLNRRWECTMLPSRNSSTRHVPFGSQHKGSSHHGAERINN
jgi:hypothetical protein